MIDAKGGWVNSRYFLHTLYFSQFHVSIHELEKDGVKIEHSTFKDEFGFMSYRIKTDEQNAQDAAADIS